MADTTCSTHDCASVVYAMKLCNRHYREDWKRRHPCAFDGCKNGRVYKDTGFCGTHQSRLVKHGDPAVTMKGKYHKVAILADGRKVCTGCGESKPLDGFHRDASGTAGRRARCKVCETIIERERYLANVEESRRKQRERRARNLEAHREYDRLRYERDRDARIELATMHSQARRARLANAVREKGVTRTALRKRDGDACHYCGVIMDFSRATGRKFNSKHATVEHVIPLSRGGSHTMANSVLACRRCNCQKNSRTVEEWKELATYGR